MPPSLYTVKNIHSPQFDRKAPPTPEISVRELAANPVVVRVVQALRRHRQLDMTQLSRRVDRAPHQLAPVMREMQRAGMVRIAPKPPGTRIVRYQLLGDD